MKIAMIGVRGIPSNSGGAEHVVEQLSVRLAKTHHVTVYCRKHYIENMPAQYKGVYLKYVSCITSVRSKLRME